MSVPVSTSLCGSKPCHASKCAGVCGPLSVAHPTLRAAPGAPAAQPPPRQQQAVPQLQAVPPRAAQPPQQAVPLRGPPPQPAAPCGVCERVSVRTCCLDFAAAVVCFGSSLTYAPAARTTQGGQATREGQKHMQYTCVGGGPPHPLPLSHTSHRARGIRPPAATAAAAAARGCSTAAAAGSTMCAFL